MVLVLIHTSPHRHALRHHAHLGEHRHCPFLGLSHPGLPSRPHSPLAPPLGYNHCVPISLLPVTWVTPSASAPVSRPPPSPLESALLAAASGISGSYSPAESLLLAAPTWPAGSIPIRMSTWGVRYLSDLNVCFLPALLLLEVPVPTDRAILLLDFVYIDPFVQNIWLLRLRLLLIL